MSVGEMKAEYEVQLRIHDWLYEFSDDFRVYSKGKREREQLERMQKALDPDCSIWNNYAPEEFKRKG